MGQISSINFKKSNVIQTEHNDRKLPPNYLIGGNFECNRNSIEANKLKKAMIENSIEAYQRTKAQKAPNFKAKSYEWSAVCNIKPETTMQDLEKLSEHFFTKYGFQCYQIAIHRDEGHINEQGEKVINHHAHMEFITLDKKTGKNNYNRQKISPKVLRQIQGEVAEILQMQRGEDKRLSGRQRIEPRKYAQMKEAEKGERKEFIQKHKKDIDYILDELDNVLEVDTKQMGYNEAFTTHKAKALSEKEIKKRLEQERKAWIQEKTHTAEEYKELRALNKQQYSTIQELETQIQKLNEDIKNEKSKLKALESDLKQKEQKNDELVQKINEMDLKGNFERLNDKDEENKKLRKENEELKQELEEVRLDRNQAYKVFYDLSQEYEQLKEQQNEQTSPTNQTFYYHRK